MGHWAYTTYYTLMYRDKHHMEVIELCSDVIETLIYDNTGQVGVGLATLKVSYKRDMKNKAVKCEIILITIYNCNDRCLSSIFIYILIFDRLSRFRTWFTA